MSVPAQEGAVVPARPLAQAHAVAATVVALAALVIVLVEEPDRLETALFAVVTAAIYSAIMLVVSRRGSAPPAPLRISRDELPPVSAVWKVFIRTAWYYPLFYAAVVWFALSQPNQHTTVGIALSLPVILWFRLHGSVQAARDSGDTMWNATAGPLWRSKVRYLTPDGTSAGRAGVTADGWTG